MDEMMKETPSQSAFPYDHDRTVDVSSPNSSKEIRKTSTPDPLKVPKPFKYPERYTSPTDLMVSPVSKGLLARTRKTTPLLPPTVHHNKTEDSKLMDLGPFANLEV